MKRASIVFSSLVLLACGGRMGEGTDAGTPDSGPGPVDAGMDAGSVTDAGPNPVYVQVNAGGAIGLCRNPSENEFMFVLALSYGNTDSVDQTFTIESVTVTLDQAPMTTHQVTFDITSVTIPANTPIPPPMGGTILIRHASVAIDPAVANPCGLCGTSSTVSWEIRGTAAGRPLTLSGQSGFGCVTM